jgi:hypothetical protein
VVSFVLSNPNHHAEIMLPVLRDLVSDGVRCQLVSLAELRGLDTPRWDLGMARVHRAFPRVRRNPSSGAGGGGRVTGVRSLVRAAVWHGVIAPRLRWLLRDSRVVVVPNDAAFPYRGLAEMMRRAGKRVVLIQEGIRFPLPNEHGDDVYGRGGAHQICVWGEGSAEHFRALGVPASTIRVTGNPRFDSIDPAEWRERRDSILRGASFDAPPLLYLSNPVDDQGFCSTDVKLGLFERFLVEASPILARRGIQLAVRLHPREDRAAFQRIIDRARMPAKLVDGGLFQWLASARAAVVLTSTVGLEALAFGVPIGVLEMPGHGFAFEYVSRGAAVGIRADGIAVGVETLLDASRHREQAGVALLDRHLAYRGEATHRIAEAIRGQEAA